MDKLSRLSKLQPFIIFGEKSMSLKHLNSKQPSKKLRQAKFLMQFLLNIDEYVELCYINKHNH